LIFCFATFTLPLIDIAIDYFHSLTLPRWLLPAALFIDAISLLPLFAFFAAMMPLSYAIIDAFFHFSFRFSPMIFSPPLRHYAIFFAFLLMLPLSPPLLPLRFR